MENNDFNFSSAFVKSDNFKGVYDYFKKHKDDDKEAYIRFNFYEDLKRKAKQYERLCKLEKLINE